MEDIIKLILTHLSNFFRTFLNIAINPWRAPKYLKIFDSNNIENALVFFAVSVAISAIIKISFIPDDVDYLLYATLDALWKIFLVIATSAVARLAWSGCVGTFGQYLSANCYFLGILSVLVPLIFVVLSQLPSGSVIGTAYELIFAFAISFWCYAAWFSYGIHNEKKFGTAVARLFIFILIFPPIAFTATLIRAGTVVKKAGDDYIDIESPLFWLASFGLYP